MTGAPVVPVGLIGTDRLQKPGSNMIYPRRFTIRVGKPLYFEKIGENDDRQAAPRSPPTQS